MSSPCRGDCEQGRNCYCGAVGGDRYMLESLGLLACAVLAAVIVTVVAVLLT